MKKIYDEMLKNFILQNKNKCKSQKDIFEPIVADLLKSIQK